MFESHSLAIGHVILTTTQCSSISWRILLKTVTRSSLVRLPRRSIQWTSPSLGFSMCVVTNEVYASIQWSTQLAGSIDPELSISASLYAKIPFVGRVLLTSLNGALSSGITASIDTALATGTVTSTTEQNSSGTHDLYISANLNVKFVGNIATDKFKLSTLP